MWTAAAAICSLPVALNYYAGATTLTGDPSAFIGAMTVFGGTLTIANTLVRGILGWRHAFGDAVPTTTQAFAGSRGFLSPAY